MEVDLRKTEDIRARLMLIDSLLTQRDGVGVSEVYREPYNTMIYMLAEQIKLIISKDAGKINIIDKRDLFKWWEKEADSRDIKLKTFDEA